MDMIDREKAARVWQRVKGENTPAPNAPNAPLPDIAQTLAALIAEEWVDAATYLHLSRQFQGRHSVALRHMYEQEQAHTACLKGIYTLITGTPPNVRATKPETGEPVSLLRRCYGREMRCLAEYEARSHDPHYGQVFARLAQQEQEHCSKILELLGSLKMK